MPSEETGTGGGRRAMSRTRSPDSHARAMWHARSAAIQASQFIADPLDAFRDDISLRGSR